MKKYTVNSLLCRQKSLKQRKTELESLKMNTTNRFIKRDSNGMEHIEEPLYNIKKVDSKVVSINKALLVIDEEIKRSNAQTTVEIDEIDFDKLMSEIDE